MQVKIHTHHVENISQNGVQEHGLIGISSACCKKIIDCLEVKDLICLMGCSRPLLQHFRAVFNDLGKEAQIWQRIFHQRVATQAPWTELRLISGQFSISAIQNWNLAISSIINQSRLLFNDQQVHAFKTLLSTCRTQHDLQSIQSGLESIAVRKKEAQTMLKEYHSLVDEMSFINVAEFSRSATALNELYPYRALIKRRVGDHRLKVPVPFKASREMVKDVRIRSFEVWQSFLKARSGLSGTAVREPLAYKNWVKAEELVAGEAEKRLPVTIEWLEKIHRVVSEGMFNNGHPIGCCRPSEVQMFASESKRFYVHGQYVRGEMAAFMAWFTNRIALHDREQQHQWHLPWIVLTAAQSSQWLVSIHPFGDANGRVSRLLMDYVLQRYGILPPVLSQWIAPVWGDNQPNVDADHAFTLVWDGIKESYRLLKAVDKK